MSSRVVYMFVYQSVCDKDLSVSRLVCKRMYNGLIVSLLFLYRRMLPLFRKKTSKVFGALDVACSDIMVGAFVEMFFI